MKKLFFIIIFCFPVFFGGELVMAQTSVTPDLDTLLQPTSCTSGDKDCYQLLEYIPLETGPINSVNVSASGEEGIAGFLNFMFEIGIGVAGVLGVVMLVIYGFRYAANDNNINTFSVLKQRIYNVILGLLLLLGTFVILNTINPDLLILSPEIRSVTLDIDEYGDGFDPFEDDGGAVSTTPPPKGLKTTECTEGFESVGYNEVICKSIASKVKKILTDAKAAGVPLGIKDGYRSEAEQIFLRNRNCKCGNNKDCIYNKPTKQCRPETAKPGRSNHQSGVAIDFMCNGGKVYRNGSCFKWLNTNASKPEYGPLYNLPNEPWHWSTNGR